MTLRELIEQISNGIALAFEALAEFIGIVWDVFFLQVNWMDANIFVIIIVVILYAKIVIGVFGRFITDEKSEGLSDEELSFLTNEELEEYEAISEKKEPEFRPPKREKEDWPSQY